MGGVCRGMEMPEVANRTLANGHADVVNNNGPTADGLDNGRLVDDRPRTAAMSGKSDWIDAALVAEAVGADVASVRGVVVKAAVADGDNYCSTMWRVRAEAAGRPVALIVKAPPRGEMMQDFVSSMGFFKKEAKMLAETLPAMRAIAVARCGEHHALAQQLGPRALPSSVPGVLVMEDLSQDGFRNKRRQQQLDRLHCETALEALARYHALSLALHREHPGSMEGYGEPLFVAQHENAETEQHARLHSEKQLWRFGDQVDEWEGTKDKALGEKMKRLSATIFDRMCAVVAPSPTALNVLNHGDFWINNMMFAYDEDDAEAAAPRGVRLVDLQLVRFASPALDLQYFLVTSARAEVSGTSGTAPVREELLDALLGHYLDRFNEYVTALGLGDTRWPSLGALRDEFLAKSMFGLNAMYTVLCAVVAEPEDRLQLENVTKDNMEEADISSRAWRGANFQRIIPGVLDYFARVGVFD